MQAGPISQDTDAPVIRKLAVTRPTYIRAGIKWNPLERDNIEELHNFGSPQNARRKLAAIPRQIKLLSSLAILMRVSLIGIKLAPRVDLLRKHKITEKQALQEYLKQAKLHSYDLDLCCFCYGVDGKMIGFAMPDFTEMFGVEKFHPAFVHSGDDVTGTGNAYDEELLINLHGVDRAISQIFVVVASVNHGFDQIRGGYWSIISTKDEDELMSEVMQTASKHRLHVMARLVRDGDGTTWAIKRMAEYLAMDGNVKIEPQYRIDQALTTRYLAGKSS